MVHKKRCKLVATLTIVSILAGGSQTVRGYDLTELFQSGDVWGASPVDFFGAVNEQGKPAAFDWASQAEQTRARYPAWKNSPQVTLVDLPLWGAAAFFESDGLSKVECSLYNKGDAEMAEGDKVIRDRQQFLSKLKNSADKIDRWVGRKGENIDPKRLTTSGIKMMRRVWVRKPYLIELRWAFTEERDRFLAEYITAVFTPYSRENDPTVAHISSVHDRYEGWAEDKDRSDNVKQNFQGDNYIAGVPMVNQGEKGYCVVAALERMLRYYGAEIDQHALAQLGQSSGKSGTIMENMIDTLEKADTKLGIHVRVEYNIGEDVRDYTRLVSKYNREARRMDKPKIADEQWIVRQGKMRLYSIAKLMAALDPDVYRTVREKRFYADLNRFQRTLKEEVTAGRPVLWGVWLGIVQEAGINIPDGGVSGHARLIIGYNPEKAQILYSDTWGRGHELKRMAMKDAWAITTFLTTIKPRSRQY